MGPARTPAERVAVHRCSKCGHHKLVGAEERRGMVSREDYEAVKAERDGLREALRGLVRLEADHEVPYHAAAFTEAWVAARAALGEKPE